MTSRPIAAALTAHLRAKKVGSAGGRLPLLTAPALAAALLAILLLAAPAAQAAPTTIAGWGQGAGRVNGPQGVAVDQTGAGGVQAGTLYVADRSNFRIDRFGPSGDFQLAWGAGVADGSEALQVCGPAVEVKRCFAGGNGAGAKNAGQWVIPSSLAVEPSSHDVYVAEPTGRRVSRYTPTGSLVYRLGPDVTFSGPGNTGTNETQTLTVKASAGTFTLGLRAPAPFGETATLQTTAPIPFDATHEELQEALEALANVEAGDLSVSGGPGDATGSAPYEVHFEAGPYAHNYTRPMGANSSELVGSQTIAVQGATAGAFTLTFKNKETAPLPYDASHEEVREALEALSTIGSGNVSVEGPEGGPWTATFTGSLSGSPQPQISAKAKGEHEGMAYELAPQGATVSVDPPAAVAATGVGPEVCEPSRGDLCKVAEGPGTAPGEFNPVASPGSLAFDSSGDLWVNDRGERAQRFDPDGSFLEEEVPLPAGTQSAALAIDPTSGDFYVLGPQGHNEGQKISLNTTPGEPGSGEFTLGFEGETAGPLREPVWPTPFQSPTEEEEVELGEMIQADLEALPAIGTGNVSVELKPLHAYAVTFGGELSGRDVPPLVPSGGSPPVTVTTTTQGNPGEVRRLDSTDGHLIEPPLDADPGDLPEALATDAAGDLYVGDAGGAYHVLHYDPAGSLISFFGAGQVLGAPSGNALALDEAAGYLYTASSRGASAATADAAREAEVAVQRFPLPAPGPLPSEPRPQGATPLPGGAWLAPLPTEATLTATVNPEGLPTHYRFQYLTEAAYQENLAESNPPFEGAMQSAEEELPAPPGAEYDEEPVSAHVEGLVPDTSYRLRITAGNEAGDTEAQSTFTTRTAIGIEAQWASELSAHQATLNAELDPLGADATWWLEYDTSPYEAGQAPHGQSVPLPHGSLSEGFGEQQVAVSLRGLQAATAYHYRFVATDVREVTEGGELLARPFTTYGEGQSFTTQPAALGFSLPDSRAWELVSPADKHGGRIAPVDATTGGTLQAAANGEALAYLSYGSLEAHPEGNRVIEQSSELARRAPGGAWSTTDITPPHTATAPLRVVAGLEYKLFSTNLGRAVLDPHAAVDLSPQATERTPYVRDNTDPAAYTPLVTASEVPAGTEFGNALALQVLGASADLGHVVLHSSVALAEGDAKGSLYEWSGGELSPLSVPPGAEGAVGAFLGAAESSTRGAVSEDGTRVFWTAIAGGLYVRDTDSEETLRLDTVQPGAFGTGKVAPLFQAASADGSVAFFTDTRNLTPDANEEGADLYRWRAPGTHGCAEAGGCLQDLTAEVAPGEAAADVRLTLPGVAKDGSAAYLVATGVLDTRPNAYGESASRGELNLYAWREGQPMRFVATLSEDDRTDWGASWERTAAASPSGRYLAFMSSRPLTGYDNRALGSAERAQEVYRYDSSTEELACVSCDPSGARPQAWLEGSERSPAQEILDPEQIWGTAKGGWADTVAATLPEASYLEAQNGFNTHINSHAPRYLQNDGRVFFNARGSLVGADSNGSGDVYEYEPTGVGSCTSSSGGSGTATVPGGCVSLISSGTAEGPSAFLDASEGASDVFFYSPARLAVTDVDDQLDVYDAREGGEPATLEPVAECLGEACQPPAAAPAHPTPPTAALAGDGNLHAAAASRCARPARRAKALSRRARKLRRAAKRVIRRGAAPRKARRLGRRARRLAHRAQGTSKRAKRCRRARASRRSHR